MLSHVETEKTKKAKEDRTVEVWRWINLARNKMMEDRSSCCVRSNRSLIVSHLAQEESLDIAQKAVTYGSRL